MVRTFLRTGVLAGILALAVTGAASAQTAVQAAPASATATRVQFQRSISNVRFDVPAAVQVVGPSYRTQPGQGQGRRTRGVWITAGVTGGTLLGGWLGSKVAPDCFCDSPGLQGWLVGAPIGGAVGRLLAWRVTR
jgi:hypothetical protein